MSGKNFGPAVSGYLDPTGRNWETAVFQAGKPVLDKELNLGQDIDGGQAETGLKRQIPSGWLSDDFLTSSDPAAAIFTASAISNQLIVPNGLVAHVNGWLLKIQQTNNTGSNILDLGAGPVGQGARRNDLVVLEVWRKLISAAPSTDGKSAGGRIWQQGNVKTDPANDLVLNFADDLKDVNVGAETTKRVQIQYRLRVIQNVDVFAYPYGLEDPTVVARSVPPNAATPDGNATIFTYTNQSSNGDPGLWVAGDGNPANALGTVDGFMYAIPLLAVFRRNTTAFDRRLNQNGGVATPGPSDRPDGLFADVFVARDIIDLRLGVSTTGWSYTEILDKSVQYLFDNQLYTDWTDTSPFGGGYRGATVFCADEIGLSNAHGGDGITTGTTGVGQFLGEFDAVRRRFSGRAIMEVVTVAVPAPGGGWANGSTRTIDPTALPIYPYLAFNWASFAPATVVLHDIVDAWWLGAAGKKTTNAMPYIASVTNLGAVPTVSLTLKVGTVAPLALTNETLYVDLLIEYPTGVGMSKTATNTFGSNSFFINNPGQMPVGAPVSFGSFQNQAIDSTHREVQLEYQTANITIIQAADTVVNNDSTFRLPERAQTIVSVLKNAVPIVGGTVIDATGRIVTFTNAADFTNPGDTLTITYTGIRPMPQNGEQMTIYYAARAPQAARGSMLGTSLQVIPKYVGPAMFVITTGSGSQDEGYPFPMAYVQTGGIYPTSAGTYTGEAELSARGDVSVAEFNATTGFLRLPTFIPMVAAPEGLTFQRGLGDIDVEGRSYFKTVPGGYVPNAYAQDLSDPKRHKDVLPMICELAADSTLGHRGQLVLVLLIRYALFDETDGVFFNANLTQNTTTAAVFRIKGNLLDKRAV
jgi:hypothetical protein